MPLYEYECDRCGKRVEVRHPVGENADQRECPSCGAVGLRRVYSFNCAGSGSSDSDFYGGGGGGSSCSTCSSGNCASCGM